MNSRPEELPVEESAKGNIKEKDPNENPKGPQVTSFSVGATL